MSVGALPLRLVRVEVSDQPAGLRLTRAAAAALRERIAPRIARYAGLRLALAGGEAIVFAPEPAALPWCEAPLGWLASDGPLFLPYAMRLDVPAPWRSAVARRLLDKHGIAGPALLLPGMAGLRLLDLSGSRMLAEIDAGRLGRQPG